VANTHTSKTINVRFLFRKLTSSRHSRTTPENITARRITTESSILLAKTHCGGEPVVMAAELVPEEKLRRVSFQGGLLPVYRELVRRN
jgi:hypothetical protein